MEDKFMLSESIHSRTSLCSYFLSWKIYLFTGKKFSLWAAQKWLFHCAYFCDWGMKKDVFCGINVCDVGILWKKMRNLFLGPQCFNKTFSNKSEKDDRIYMGIIYMSFLLRNLLYKNIYTVSSFVWSNELFRIRKWWLYLYCVFLFSFVTYEVSYSKNVKVFRRNAKFILAIGFQTLFLRLTYCILRIKFLRFRAKITKISSATIYEHKIFCA